MNIRTLASTGAVLALAAALATGCGGAEGPPPAGDSEAPAAQSWIGRKAEAAITKARQEMETGNLKIGGKHGFSINGTHYGPSRSNGLPPAEITPDGELLIEDSQVPVTGAQRELLLDYRNRYIDVAQAGMAIGLQGADIAGKALGGIGSAVFGGEEGRREYEARIEAESARIKDEARRLCTLLPPLHDSQQALAASLPEFEPYATLTLQDIEDCGKGDDA